MFKGTIRTLLFLLLCQGAYAEETVYVHDHLRLGVRAIPDSTAGSIAVVSTGDALTVLGEQEGYLNIRTEGGLEGWVSKGYVSTEPPAILRLQQLQQTHDLLQQAHKKLQQSHQSLKKQYDALQNQQAEQQQQSPLNPQQDSELQQLQEDNASLQRQLEALKDTPPAPAEATPYSLILSLLTLALITAIVGFVFGIRWKAQRVAERIGGLQL